MAKGNCNTAVSVEWLVPEPCWNAESELLFARQFIRRVEIAFLNVLLNAGSIDIG